MNKENPESATGTPSVTTPSETDSGADLDSMEESGHHRRPAPVKMIAIAAGGVVSLVAVTMGAIKFRSAKAASKSSRSKKTLKRLRHAH